jgi:hypothetical protein
VINGAILFINSTYLQTATSFFLATFYIKADSVGNNVNTTFTLLLAAVLILFPIFVGVFYSKNSPKIVRQNENFMSRWGELVEGLNFKRQGKKVILLPVSSLLRKLILSASLVYLQDWPIFITIFIVFHQIKTISILVGFIEPFTNPTDHRMLLVNETFVMLTIYCQICFTDFNPDPVRVYQMGYCLVFITILNVFINISRLLWDTSSKGFRWIKLRYMRRLVMQRHAA